jgi:hypothetical protein
MLDTNKAEQLGKEIEKRIEIAFCEHYQDKNDFWENEAKRIYSALHELISYTIQLEKELVK